MASEQITIWVKNMAGDLLSISIHSGLTAEEGLQMLRCELSEMNHVLYPFDRIRLVRMEDENEPLRNEEVVCLFLQSAYVETVEDGMRENRIVIPVGEQTIYLYYGVYQTKVVARVHFIATIHSDSTLVVPHSVSRHGWNCTLGNALDHLGMSLTPAQRSSVYRQAMPLLEQQLKPLYPKTMLNPDLSEVLQCGCGSTIHRDAVANHVKTKKHIAYVTAHPEDDIKVWTRSTL